MTDTMAGRGGVGIRLYTSGGEVVKRTFDQVGDSGRKMWAEIALGEKAANPAVRALSSGVNEAKGGVDALAARTGAAGSVLGAFGFAGIGAAAALGGLAVAMGKAKEAMAFADEIDDSAQKLGIGTDALQEYRFAMTEVGGSVQDADAAISGFQKKLGEGLAGGRSKKWFEQIGITPAELRSFKDTEEALDAVLDGISKLGTEAERAAVAEKLGLGPMVALAREGSDKLEELRQKAQDLGYVMDDALVKKGADANQQFETMSTIIDVQLKSAFVDLSDEVLAFTGWIAGALGGLNNFIAVFDKWKTRTNALYGDNFVDDLTSGNSGRAFQSAAESVRSGRTTGAAAIIRQGGDLYAGTASRADLLALAAPPKPIGGDTRLTDLSSGRGRSGGSGAAAKAEREAEQRRQRQERVADQTARVEADMLREMQGEYRTIAEGHGFARDRIEAASKERDLAIALAQGEFERTKGLRGISDAEASILREKEALLTAAKLENDQQKERREQAARRLEDEETAAQAAADMLGIDADLAKTAGARAQIQREILVIEQKIARDRLEQQLKNDNELTDDQISGRLTAFDRRATGQLSVFDHNEDSRLREQFKGYGREVAGAIRDGRLGEYIGDQLKTRLLDGALDALFSVMQGGSKGGEGGSWVNAAVSFGKSLFAGGRAAGGGANAGQFVTTNEHGTPELLMLGGAGHVTNAAETARMIKGLAGPAGGNAGGTTVHEHHYHNDFSGAVTTAEFIQGMDARAERARQAAVAQSTDIARRAAPGYQQRQRRLGTS